MGKLGLRTARKAKVPSILEHVFGYYISHNSLINALQFVMSRVPPLENHTPCPYQIISLCSQMPHVTKHLSDTLLDELAR